MNKSPWRFYLRFYEGSRHTLFLSIVISVIQSLAVLPIALFVRAIFDVAIPEKDFSRLLLYSILIFFLYLLEGTFTLWTRYLSLKTTKEAIKQIRNEIIKKIYSFPRAYYAKKDRIRLHASIVQDTLRIDIMSNAFVAQLVPAGLVSLGLLAILVYLDWILFLLMIAIAPLLVVFSRIMGKVLRKKIQSYHRSFEIFSKRIMVMLNIMDLTRVRTAEEQEIALQEKIHEVLRKKSGSQAWFNAAYRIIQRTMIASCGIVILIFGGKFVLSGRMSLGDLFSFFAAVGLLRNYLMTVSSVIPQIIEGNESLSKLHALYSHRETQPYTGKKRIRFEGQIRFDSVSFRYAEKPVLEDVSLIINPHDTVGIVGPNGAGKTTLAYLILGFFKPEKGRIFADETPYSDLDIVQLRRSFGVVPQEPVIIPGTILENIIYGWGSIPKEEVDRAIKLSLCADFIPRLPKGIETYLEEKGQILSGGEIQKIAIARALLGQPRLLILDEPTNHLDSGSVEKILVNIKNFKDNPTVLIISHNRDVIKEISCIYEIQNGRIACEGSPKSVIDSGLFPSD